MSEQPTTPCPKCGQAAFRTYMGKRACICCSHRTQTNVMAVPSKDLGDGGYINVPPRPRDSDA